MSDRIYKLKLGLSAILCAIPMLAKADPEIYIIPEEATCTKRKEDKLTYCTDLEKNPITGELHRYQDNNLIRVYPLKDGLLEGTAITYYANGNPQTEKQYKKGVLDGVVREYSYVGALETEIPYVNGIKEGVGKVYDEKGKMTSQMIYSDDALNGEMRIYTPSGKTLYSFENEDNKLISGTYYFRRKGKGIDMMDIPPIVIEALNHACLELQQELTESTCAVIYKGPLSSCDENWRKANRKQVRQYLRECENGAENE